MDDSLRYVNKFPKIKVLVIGDAILDCFIKGQSSRICREAPVPIVDCREISHTPGGAANTAVNAATLGAKTTLLTVIGTDQNGQTLTEKLNSFGVNTDFVIRDKKRATLLKQRINSDFQMIVRVDFGSTSQLEKKTEKQFIKKLRQIYPLFNTVIISDYNKGIMTKKIIQELIRLQQDNPRIIIADSYRLKDFAGLHATAVKPNYQEALELLGLQKHETGENRISQIWQKKDQLLDITEAENMAVSLDTSGALFWSRHGLPVRTYTKVRDHKNASGAGDTFTAALALAISSGAPVSQTAKLCSQSSQLILDQPDTTPCFLAQLKQSLSPGQNPADDLSEFAEFISRARVLGKKIVFTNGVFDILHAGHTAYLSEAKKLGDILIVGINCDSSVRMLKGADRPVNTLNDRMAVLSALGSVDLVIPFTESTPLNLIKKIKPDIYVKGGDYSRESLPETPLVEGMGGEVEIIPFTFNNSTTKIIKKIKDNYEIQQYPLH